MSRLNPCPGCGDTDIRNVFASGRSVGDSCYLPVPEWVCSLCGYVIDTHCDLPGDQSAFSVLRKSGELHTYRRKSHVQERLSCHMAMDPIIPEADLVEIRNKFSAFARARDRPEGTYFNSSPKLRVREILRALNEEHNTKRFTNKYYEKHKQIVAHLVRGAKLKFLSPNQHGCICVLWVYFSSVWDRWQKDKPPSERKFPERIHFPNFNMTFIRCFRILKITEADVDFSEFPPPDTESSVSDNTRYLDALESEARDSGFIKDTFGL